MLYEVITPLADVVVEIRFELGNGSRDLRADIHGIQCRQGAGAGDQSLQGSLGDGGHDVVGLTIGTIHPASNQGEPGLDEEEHPAGDQCIFANGEDRNNFV